MCGKFVYCLLGVWLYALLLPKFAFTTVSDRFILCCSFMHSLIHSVMSVEQRVSGNTLRPGREISGNHSLALGILQTFQLGQGTETISNWKL